MAKEVLFLVEDAVEGGYIARALGHSIFTEADSWEELKFPPAREPSTPECPRKMCLILCSLPFAKVIVCISGKI